EDIDVLDGQVVEVVAENGELVVVEHADVLDVDVDRKNGDRADAAYSLDAVLVAASEAAAAAVLGQRGSLIITASLVNTRDGGHRNNGREHDRANRHSKPPKSDTGSFLCF